MTNETKNRYGLTEKQVGKYATDDKPTQYPQFDVTGRKYVRGEISMYPLTKDSFVILPAGYKWDKESAAEAFKPEWDKQEAASVATPPVVEKSEKGTKS